MSKALKPTNSLTVVANDISQKIKQQFFEEKKGETEITFSSTSILLCSLLAYPGMNNNTKKQFEKTFFEEIGGTDSLFSSGNKESYDLLAEAVNYFRNILNMQDEKNKCEVRLSNTSYIDSGFTPLETFVGYLQKMGNIERFNMNADLKGACDYINQKISDDTNGNIKDILKPEMLLPKAIMVLVNALYFEAKWLHKFSKWGLDGDPMHFTKSNGEIVELYNLVYRPEHGHKPFSCFEDNNIKLVSIPYKNQDYAMLIIVPKPENESVDARKINVSDYLNMVLEKKYCRVEIPQWTQRTNIDLNDILSDLGMPDMFNGGVADFTKLTEEERIWVSVMIHEAFIEVDENGTKAAAATVMGCVAECAGPPPPKTTFKIKADRTFGWAIYHVPSKLSLFEGVYDGSIGPKILAEMEEEEAEIEQKNLEEEQEFIKKNGSMFDCFGNKKERLDIWNQLWFEDKSEGPQSTNVYCLFCKQNGCNNKKYSMVKNWKLEKKLKVEEVDFPEVHCSCQLCPLISEGQKKERVDAKKRKEYSAGLEINENYKKQCFGKQPKKAPSFKDEYGEQKWCIWFAEEGKTVQEATFCQHCAEKRCHGLINKRVYEIPQVAYKNFGQIMCDCPTCQNP